MGYHRVLVDYSVGFDAPVYSCCRIPPKALNPNPLNPRPAIEASRMSPLGASGLSKMCVF